MIHHDLATTGEVERAGKVPAYGRGAPPIEGCARDLAAVVEALAPWAPPEDRKRLAEAVSLRGVALVGALLDRFEDLDEALAGLEDYAGAFDDLIAFVGDVAAARFPFLPTPADDVLAAYGASLIARGEVFPLRLGDDLHLFWSV
ncbi:MAG: hypothetical protein AAFR11_04610 [Pseudomonadota bacterium]